MWLNFLVPAISNMFFLALHVQTPSAFPKPLSESEEKLCFELMEKGDEDAKNKLVEHNLRLVAHIIKKYYYSYKDQDDLISIGTIGLIKAVCTFDYRKGSKFTTYASRCIENVIHPQQTFYPFHRSLRRISGEALCVLIQAYICLSGIYAAV